MHSVVTVILYYIRPPLSQEVGSKLDGSSAVNEALQHFMLEIFDAEVMIHSLGFPQRSGIA